MESQDLVSIATGMFHMGVGGVPVFGSVLLCYTGQTTPTAKDDILHMLFAPSILGNVRAGITGLDDIGPNLLARITDSPTTRTFMGCSFDAEASVLLTNNETCLHGLVAKNKFLDGGTRLVEHLISSQMELTSVSVVCLSMFSYENLVRLLRSTKERGSCPVVEGPRDYRIGFSFDDGMYRRMQV